MVFKWTNDCMHSQPTNDTINHTNNFLKPWLPICQFSYIQEIPYQDMMILLNLVRKHHWLIPAICISEGRWKPATQNSLSHQLCIHLTLFSHTVRSCTVESQRTDCWRECRTWRRWDFFAAAEAKKIEAMFQKEKLVSRTNKLKQRCSFASFF